MSSNISGILGKAEQDRRRGDFKKALKRLEDAIKKSPEESMLYHEAIDTALEAGESLRASQYLKAAQRRTTTSDELWNFCLGKVEAYNDAILCKSMVDVAIKKRDLQAAEEVLKGLKDHTADQLLQRTRNKKQSFGAMAGDEFRIELVTNSLAEALLHARTKRFQEAAKAFIQIIDDKPVEAESVTPYLTGLQKRYPSKGSIRFALGCSCLASEDYEQGLAMILRGVELAPVNAADAIARIENLRTVNDVREDRIEMALAEISILDEDDTDAAERLRDLMDSVPARVHEVLELLEPHVEEIGSTPELNYLYAETALKKGEGDRAINQIRCLANDRREKTRLLDWLDERFDESFMTVAVLTLFGELALQQKAYDQAVRALRVVLGKAPHEMDQIKDLVFPHRNETVVQELYVELAGDAEEKSTGGSGFSIEHYGGNDFTLDGSEQAGTKAPRSFDKEDKPAVTSDSEDDLSEFADYTDARAEVFGEESSSTTGEESSSTTGEESSSTTGDGFELERDLDLGTNTNETPVDDTPTVIELTADTNTESPTEETATAETAEAWLENYLNNSARPMEDSKSSDTTESLKEDRDFIGNSARPMDDSKSSDTTESLKEDRDFIGNSARPMDDSKSSESTEAPTDDREAADGDEEDDFMDREPPEVRMPDEPKEGFQDLPEDNPPAIKLDYSMYENAEVKDPEDEPGDSANTFDDRDTVLIEPSTPSASDDENSDVASTPIILGDDDDPNDSGEYNISDARGTSDAQDATSEATEDPDSQTDDPDPQTDETDVGGSNGDNVIAAIEEAARLGRMEEMKELLKFEPQNEHEAFKRKLYLAEYYLRQDRPVSALAILKTISVNDLDKEDRKTFLLRNAFCYQQLNRFDAAQSVYLRLMSEYPEFEAAEYMAHVNYQRHLQSSVSGGQALEKVSSLHEADKKEEEQ